MTVKLENLVKNVIFVAPDTSIIEVKDKLVRYKIGRIIVKSGKKAVGIITEKDIARSISKNSKKPILKLKAENIMSKDLVTVNLKDDLKKCAQKMIEKNISSVIVNDDSGNLEGVITKTDLVSSFLIQSTARTSVSKVMTKEVITVSPEDSILEVESVLLNNRISRVIVTKDKFPVGVITYRDFVPSKTLGTSTSFVDPVEVEEISWNPRLNEINAKRIDYLLTFQAKDIMVPNPFVAYPSDPIYTAAILMIRNGISGLPVIRGKKLVGIITKTDIVKILAGM